MLCTLRGYRCTPAILATDAIPALIDVLSSGDVSADAGRTIVRFFGFLASSQTANH